MTDLLNTPLSAAEVDALPDRLRLKYWAGEIGEGVPGLTQVRSEEARYVCRTWLHWQRTLAAGTHARYTGIADGLRGKECVVRDPAVKVAGLGRLVRVEFLGGWSTLVAPCNLEPAS